MTEAALELFANEYARHRDAEGRGYDCDTLLQLPYLDHGPHAAQWRVRARTFDAFMEKVLRPAATRANRSLDVLDLGAGNGWLSYRVALEAHRVFALDIRDDAIDGLGAATPFRSRSEGVQCIIASFDSIPLSAGSADLAVFNASLHYATDLAAVLRDATRVTRSGGEIAILDSPFYDRESDGLAMVQEKRAAFGSRADVLMALPFIEFLTRERLRKALPDLKWTRHRVRYGLAYELRPLVAAIRRRRRPSRFDLWVAKRP
ncbi:MAG TPA: class I SAM-dependent methyltransferase [Sphingomicrobium sp.]|jgi:SAM-dependent methyltransferase|nr:class I SAM-dependent methyltransferase [Sphingomicrobium sp.]